MPDRMLNPASPSLKVAVVHEWLVDYSGSERVLEQLLNLFPQADLYAVVEFLPDNLRGFIQHKKVTTSFIQRLPQAKKRYRQYLPLMPLAIEQFDLSGYDLVLTSSHCVAKGVITGPDQLHISYCYSPMRYAWDLTHLYLRESGMTTGLKSWISRLLLHGLRQWDYRTSAGVDQFVSISQYIKRRIEKVYRRDSIVVHPPVDTAGFTIGSVRDDFYLAASRFVPYKRLDLIVQSFAKHPDKQLIVIGDGPEFEKVRALAGPNVTLLGYQPFDVLRDHMQRAKGFLFAAEEDFGIIPLEAQACGTPVIAFGKGGALDTVLDGQTGIFFHEQTADAIADAIKRFESVRQQFQAESIRRWALTFSQESFRRKFMDVVHMSWGSFAGRYSSPEVRVGENRLAKREMKLMRAPETTEISELFHG